MTIPYGRQDITQDDIDAVSEVLASDFLTQGPLVPRFEQAIADVCKAHDAIAVTNATSALHLACLALDIGPGDLVWTVPNTFVASANCARYCGADIDFVDIDPTTGNLCPDALRQKLTSANHLPKVLIPVHFGGASCDMQTIADLVKPYGIRIIEDASHAIGARYQGEPVGNCLHSDICVFSFHPVKIITTGEGGMLTTNDVSLAERLRLLRSHGITRDTQQFSTPNDEPWYYEQQTLGFNCRMTDIQAALGLSQLKRLQAFITTRKIRVSRYQSLLAGIENVKPLTVEPASDSAWHLFVIQVPATSRRVIFEHLRAAGIGVNVHYIPVHTQPYYRQLGFKTGDFPQSEAYYAGAITLPLHPNLSDEQQLYIVEQLIVALEQYAE